MRPAEQLGFLANPRYRAQLAATQAGAIVLRAADADGYAGTALIADDPYVAFARIAALFERTPRARTGHPRQRQSSTPARRSIRSAQHRPVLRDRARTP